MGATQGSIAVATVWSGADRGVGKESWKLRPLALACALLREHRPHWDCPSDSKHCFSLSGAKS